MSAEEREGAEKSFPNWQPLPTVCCSRVLLIPLPLSHVAMANELIALQLISFVNTAGAVIVVNLRISATKSQRRLLFLHLLVVSREGKRQHLRWRVCLCTFASGLFACECGPDLRWPIVTLDL